MSTQGTDNTGELLMRVGFALRRRFADAAAPYGLSPHQVRALRHIDGDGPLRPGTLAATLRISPRSVTDVVDGLEGAGFVVREPDPTDRRAQVLRATDEGRHVLARVLDARSQSADAWLQTLSASDRAELHRLLTRLDATA